MPGQCKLALVATQGPAFVGTHPCLTFVVANCFELVSDLRIGKRAACRNPAAGGVYLIGLTKLNGACAVKTDMASEGDGVVGCNIKLSGNSATLLLAVGQKTK